MKTPNIRDMSITTGSGTDVKNTSQLKGEAQKTPAEKESNVTKQYETAGGVGKGSLGGKASGA